MGETVTVNNGNTDNDTKRENSRGKGQSGGDTSTENARNENRGNGNGTGRGQTEGSTTDKEKIVPQLAIVEVQTEEDKREERNRKRRERYAKQKAENGGTVKPRKVNGTTKKTDNVDSTQIEMLLVTTFAIIGSREGLEMWVLKPDEAKAIATPLTNILAKSEAFSNMGEYSDAIALTIACLTILVPRFIVMMNSQKEKKKYERTGNKTDTNVKAGKIEGNNRKSDRTNTTDNAVRSHDLSIFGNAVS